MPRLEGEKGGTGRIALIVAAVALAGAAAWYAMSRGNAGDTEYTGGTATTVASPGASPASDTGSTDNTTQSTTEGGASDNSAMTGADNSAMGGASDNSAGGAMSGADNSMGDATASGTAPSAASTTDNSAMGGADNSMMGGTTSGADNSAMSGAMGSDAGTASGTPGGSGVSVTGNANKNSQAATRSKTITKPDGTKVTYSKTTKASGSGTPAASPTSP